MKLFNKIIPKSFTFAISKSKFSANAILAKISVKRGHPLIDNLLQIIYTMGGKITPNWVRMCSRLVRELHLIEKHQGPKGLVKYLKVCSVCLQQVSAGYTISDLTPLGMRISRAKSGLPRIIPSKHRKLICDGNSKVLRFYLTVFSIYRDIHFNGELKLSTITQPSTGTSLYADFHKYVPYFKNLVFLKDSAFTVENDLNSLFPILTSGPQVSKSDGVTFNSHSMSVLRSLIVFRNYPELRNSLTILAQYMYCSRVLNILSTFFNYWSDAIASDQFVSKFDLGKLAIKEEAAGKVRVFAMVDPLTQWVLAPLHKKLFLMLKKIPMDGTFNQLKPLVKVPYGKVPLYSFDLSAATDRLPIELQKIILGNFYSQEFALHWANLLVGRHYAPPYISNKEIKGQTNESIFYSVGQPMGALSSWAMLAITHHLIVQTAAWKAGVVPKTQLFTSYAVLGDDIVIWNKTVASGYLALMKELGVEVGLAKSIISHKGKGIEFAKRTIVNGIDVSPIPFKEQGAAHTSLSILKQFAIRYGMTFNNVLKFLGYGYKVCPQKNNRIVRAINTAWRIPSCSEELLQIFQTRNISFGQFKENPLAFPPSLIRKALVKLVADELLLIHTQAKTVEENLLQYVAGVLTNRAVYPRMTDIITADIAESVTPLWFRDLDYVKRQALLMRDSISDIIFHYNSFMFDQPEIFNSDRHLLKCLDFQRALKFMFSASKTLDLIQCDNLIKPVSQISQSPSFLEEQRTLRLWAKWATTFSKVDTAVLVPFNKGLAFNSEKYINN